MSRLQQFDAGQRNVALPADDLIPQKAQTFIYPQEVLDDHELTLADKRALLASWASDALAVEDSPSHRQLKSGAVVRVDDMMAALKSLDLEDHDKVAWVFSRSFARHPGKPLRWRSPRLDEDDEPPPAGASARISAARTVLAVRQGSTGTGLEVTNGPAASALANSREIIIGRRSAA
jgi:hypothetical protein